MESVARDFDSGEGLGSVKEKSASNEKEGDNTPQETDRRCVIIILLYDLIAIAEYLIIFVIYPNYNATGKPPFLTGNL